MEPFISPMHGVEPDVSRAAFIAPGAAIIGKVSLGQGASVWYGVVLRGDDDRIVLGDEVNVQDGCILHADPGFPVLLGDRVSLGHGAVVHGAQVDDDVLIGMRATVLNGARIGSGTVIAAGAVVLPGVEIPPGSLVAGVPGKVRREATADDHALIDHTTAEYRRIAREHRDQMADLRGSSS